MDKEEFELRGKLATLKCWHRLTQAEQEDLLRLEPRLDQKDRCDHHYWQDRAVKAEALVDAARADEREACANLGEKLLLPETFFETTYEHDAHKDALLAYRNAMRARGTT